MNVHPLLLIVVIGPLLLVTGVVAREAWRGQQRANRARRWPWTTGHVIAAGVREMQVRQRVSTSINSYRMVTRYAPDVTYTYQVGAVRYQGTRQRIGHVIVTSDYQEAARDASRYTAGSPVTVFYNPEDPADAILEPGATWGTRVLWLITFILLSCTLVVGVVLATA